MADKGDIERIIWSVEKRHGKGAIFTLGDKENLGVKRLATELPDLDCILEGGIPKGRIIELYGAESSGKTSLAVYLLGRKAVETGLYVDLEGSFEQDRARMFGCERGRLYVRRPEWGEQALEVVMDFVEAGADLVVVDSVPAMIPRKEFEEMNMERIAGVGMVAGLLSRKLPKICLLCERAGSTVVFINQIRDKIGGLGWGDPYTTPGGHALKHYASLRLQLARKGWLRDDKLGVYGQITKVRVVKSKVSRPWQEAELPLVFDEGFVSHEQLPASRKRLRVALKGKGGAKDNGKGQDGDKGFVEEE